MRVRRLSRAAAVVGLGALVFAGGAQACSCVKQTPRQALRDSDAALVARLVEVVRGGGYSARYRYRVQRVYKPGQGLRRGRTVSVRSGADGASCGLPDGTGRRYGLFLYRQNGRWTGTSCAVVTPRELSATAAGGNRGRDASASISTPDCVS